MSNLNKTTIQGITMNTYGKATNQHNQTMLVTEIYFNDKDNLLLKGYIVKESGNVEAVTQYYSDMVECEFGVTQKGLELITLKDRELTDIIPVFFDNSGYSRSYSLLTVGEYLHLKQYDLEGEPVYLTTKEEIENIKVYSYDVTYDEYLEQKQILDHIVDVIDGKHPEIEYELSRSYIQSIWLQLDASCTENPTSYNFDDLPF